MKRKLTCVSVLLAMSAVMACDRSESTPLDPDSPPAFLLAVRGYLTGWSASSEDNLKALLELEKARLQIEKERNKVIEDSLKIVWAQFKSQGRDQDKSPLLMCDPLQYTADTKIIGPEGGDLSIGPHKLSIPKGALSRYTVISAEAPTSTNVEVRLSPHGLQFLKTPMLMLSYKHCFVPHVYSYQMGYVADDRAIREWTSSFDSRAGELYGWIWHFSVYAIVTGYTPAGGRPGPRQYPAAASVGKKSAGWD